MKKFLEEFKEFISRGNVMDMAVGVIIGGAFSSIVTSLRHVRSTRARFLWRQQNVRTVLLFWKKKNRTSDRLRNNGAAEIFPLI